MILVTTLVGLMISVVDQTASTIVILLMSVVASLYISIPFTNWLPIKKSGLFDKIMIPLFWALGFLILIMPIMKIAEATFQIDRTMAKQRYHEYLAKAQFSACARAARPYDECVRYLKEAGIEVR
jgi:hypothetical protein